MAQRRYGPSRGAGVVIIEKDAEKSIQESPLGVTTHVGVYERGEVGKMNFCPNKKAFAKKMGGRITNGWLAPDAALDFFDLGEGAGEFWPVRVTDGTEVDSVMYLMSRRLPRTAVQKVEAKNGGRWGGKRAFNVNVWDTTATDLKETTLDTGLTMLKNYWAGGYLKLKDVPTKQYLILSNDVAGKITVVSDATMLADYNDASGSGKEFSLELDNAGKYLAVKIMDGIEKPTEEYGMEVYLDGVLVLKKENLSSDPTDGRYFVNAINDDTGNDEIKVTDLWTGGWAADIRPANHFESLTQLSATVAKVEIIQSTTNSPGGGNAVAGGFTYGQSLKQQTLTLTFSDATNYAVVSDKFGALGSGIIGTVFAPSHGVDNIPGFNVTVGSSPLAATDTIVIEVNPLVPDELIGGLIFPDKVGNRRESFIITDNTVDTVTVKASDDMTINATSGVGATVTGTVTGGLFDTSANDTLDLSVDGGALQSITLTANASLPIATALSEINAVFPGLATDDGAGSIKLTSTIGGRHSRILIGAGNANTAFGFTDDANYWGTVGESAMISWEEQMGGGYDGLAGLSDSHFTAIYDTDLSPINEHFGRNKGLVKLATPGNTATAVQKAGAAYAEARNYQYRYEVPSNIVTEDAAEEYINDTIGRNDFAVVAFPSYGYMANPVANSEGLKLISLTGAYHGREAKMARTYEGYHKAAAGVDVILPHILKLPTGDKVLDEEILNPQGIAITKFSKGNCIIWGDRTVSIDPGWKWKHQRETMSHYENTLRENFDWIIFAINDKQTWHLAYVALQGYFLGEWKKRALRGDSAKQAFSIKIDSEINTNATMASGDLNAEIKLRLADTVERFKITMSKLGIFEEIG